MSSQDRTYYKLGLVALHRTDKAVGFGKDRNSGIDLWLPLSLCKFDHAVRVGQTVQRVQLPNWLGFEKDLTPSKSQHASKKKIRQKARKKSKRTKGWLKPGGASGSQFRGSGQSRPAEPTAAQLSGDEQISKQSTSREPVKKKRPTCVACRKRVAGKTSKFCGPCERQREVEQREDTENSAVFQEMFG